MTSVGAKYGTPMGELRIEREMIDVTSASPYADEDWTYTDQQGHPHRYDHGYPTLTWIIDRTYWCEDCGDEHTEGHYECPLCGERIEPGLKGPDMSRRYMPGRTSYYLDDEEISPERFAELAEQYRR
jgi:DNA-directed RNA polymerase subunit RPC12/RpoP